MTQQLRELIVEVIRKEEVGTLFLGRGNRVRSVFFSGGAVHLLEAAKQCRFVPAPALYDVEGVTQETFRELIESVHHIPQSLALIMKKQELLPPDHLADYLRQEELEEIWLILSKTRGNFVFEEGNVPEELLLPTELERADIPAKAFLRFLDKKDREVEDCSAVLPSQEEILVLSEKGIAAHASGGDWVFSQIADLIDGFRNIQQVLRDSPFFPHLTTQVLVHATRGGWLKKTRFPELKSIPITKLSHKELLELVPRMEEAAVMAVDEMPVRRALSGVCVRLGDRKKAIDQFLIMGDDHFQRGEHTKALSLYQEALGVDAAAPRVRRKLFSIYSRFAEEALARKDRSEARSHLEEAIHYDPSSLDTYLRIAATYENEPAVLRITPRLLKSMKSEGGDPDLPLRFFEALVERFPDGVGVRKKLVNILVDRGERERALQELQYLAGDLLNRGMTEEAQGIYQKIKRIDPNCAMDETFIARLGKGARAEAPRKKRTRRPSKALAIVVVVVAAFAGYQFFILQHLKELDRRVYALTSSPLPAIGTEAAQQMQNEAAEILLDYQGFHRRHFVNIWSNSATTSMKTVESRISFLENRTQVALERAWEDAKREDVHGRFDAALARLREIQRKGKNTSWGEKARRRIEEIEGYRDGAERLFEAGNRACAENDYPAAFEIFSELLIDYPRSTAAREVRLPVLFMTTPSGARVFANGEVLGITPTVLWLDPFEPLELRLKRAGFPDLEYTLDNPVSYRVTVPLQR